MGMEGLSAKGGESRLGPFRQQRRLGPKAGPVSGVPEQRMAGGSEVDPDLVGAAGFKLACEEARYRLASVAGLALASPPARCPGIALDDLPVGDGLAAAVAHGHAVARLGMAVDRGLDGAPRPGRRPPDEGEIAAPECSPSRPWLANCSASARCARSFFATTM